MMGGPRGLLEQEVSKPRSVGRTLGRLGGYFRPFWFALVGVLVFWVCFIIVDKLKPTPAQFPRRTGVPNSTPLVDPQN